MKQPDKPYKTSHKVHELSVGDRRLLVRGLAAPGLHDIYHLSMTISWPQFYAWVAGLFMLLNLVFAALYDMAPGAISNLSPVGYWGAFFFSVETLATVGYADMHPATNYGHTIATLEVFIGMMSVAMITGLTFARFSRPRAKIVASRHAVINQFNGQKVLMIRAANARKSMIVQAFAKLHIMLMEQSPEGHRMRRLYDLKLVREEHPMFFLSWTLIHVIDDTSPLQGHDAESLLQSGAGLVLTVSGVDEVTTQDLSSRHIFAATDILWQHVFEDMLHVDAKGLEVVDYDRLDATRPV